MIFKLHYWFLSAGANALGILMGVFIETYTDASSFEIGTLFMLMPFTGIIFRPIICSMADRAQNHRKYLIVCLFVVVMGYFPFIVIPYLGPALYKQHPRICWYFLVALKVIGDIAFGGVLSIGDSLAINYAKRIGTDFSVYRVWGTISWMCFGLITGQVNEIWFIPKYVPAFMILIASSLLDIAVIWLWPDDYFVMVTMDHLREKKEMEFTKGKKKENSMTKSLMPKEEVWAHMKGKLLSLMCCGKQINHTIDKRITEKEKEYKVQQLPTIIINSQSTTEYETDIQSQNLSTKHEEQETIINRTTQIQILALLLRRDLRIISYLMFFVCAGMSVVPVSFFFMSLSNICHEQGLCDFSQLGGLIQASMAVVETILFVYIQRIKSMIGRVNTCAMALFFVSVKYMFYGTIWNQIDPYWSLLSESLHGIIYGIYITMMVELGHLFASEVEFILPELIKKGVVKNGANADKLKLSLSATMQALISSAMDGIGRGFGALVYGLIINKYSYKTLWLTIGITSAICFLITISINLFDYYFDLQLGLDIAAKRSCSPPIYLGDSNGKSTMQKTSTIQQVNSEKV